MSSLSDRVGFSQRVRLEWLEQTAALVLAGADRAAADDALQGLLRDKVSIGGTAQRGNREKIITILLRVWLSGPPELDSLRTRGLEWLRDSPPTTHIAIHWGMVMAVYPFWTDLACQVGRLLKLQGSASAAQAQRRMREQYGERETVARATRRVLRSYIDWGVLSETGVKGVYSPQPPRPISAPGHVGWLIEALLHSQSVGRAPLKSLLQSPCTFPFRLQAIPAADLVHASPRLTIVRHGLDDDLVALCAGAD